MRSVRSFQSVLTEKNLPVAPPEAAFLEFAFVKVGIKGTTAEIMLK
jgi:hypothetical protein